MRSRALPVLIALAMVALAGCGGVFGGGGASPETNGTAADDGAYPPGVTSSGLENATALVAAHDRSLRGESFRLAVGQEQTFASGEQNVTASSERVVRMAGNGTFRVDARSRGTLNVNETVWANGSTAYVRSEQGDQVQYVRRNATAIRPQLTGRTLIGQYLSAGEYAVESTEQRGGERVTVLRSDEFVGTEGAGLDASNVSEYDSTAVVGPDGQVRELTVHLVAERGETTLTVDAEVTVEPTASVDVTRPDWVDEA